MNFPGRHLFDITASGPGQGLLPFRAPDAPEDGDEEQQHPVGPDRCPFKP